MIDLHPTLYSVTLNVNRLNNWIIKQDSNYMLVIVAETSVLISVDLNPPIRCQIQICRCFIRVQKPLITLKFFFSSDPSG